MVHGARAFAGALVWISVPACRFVDCCGSAGSSSSLLQDWGVTVCLVTLRPVLVQVSRPKLSRGAMQTCSPSWQGPLHV